MNRTPVRSSNIAEVGYDQESQTLEILFKSGGLYQYAGVSPEVHAAFVGAASPGAFFSERIRSQYESARVN